MAFSCIGLPNSNRLVAPHHFSLRCYLLPCIQAMHFDRDDIHLPGFHKFFKESAEEEMKHAQMVGQPAFINGF